MKPYQTAMFVALAFLCALSCSRKPDFGPSKAFHSTRFPETRSMSQAKLWLYWSTPERLAFLRGFVVAYRPALLRGCEFALDHVKIAYPKGEQTLADTALCFQQKEEFDKPVEDYEQLMTKFYKQYPDDDDVPLKFLLLELAAHKSPNDIHSSLSPRGR
jgi:hypothetical protein